MIDPWKNHKMVRDRRENVSDIAKENRANPVPWRKEAKTNRTEVPVEEKVKLTPKPKLKAKKSKKLIVTRDQ